MTKEQLEEKMKTVGEVYFITFFDEIVKLSKKDYYADRGEIENYCLDNIFSTKAEAQHYLDNGNVERTEKLPFVTYEEFKKGKFIHFSGMNEYEYSLYTKRDSAGIPRRIILMEMCRNYDGKVFETICSEKNFYKAYEVCRKLFLGTIFREEI